MRGFNYFIFSSFLLLNSCNYFMAKLPEKASQETFSESTTVSAEVVQKTVLGSCLNCHSGTKAPNLSTLDSIKQNIAKVQDEVTTNSMPPASSGYKPLSDCEKDILQEWVLEGMPDTSSKRVFDLAHCQNGSPQTPVKTPILEMPLTYETLTTQILQPRCLHCHNPDGEDPDAKDIALYPFADLVAQKNMIAADAAHSKFYKYVARTDDSRMPPPEDGAPLDADQIEFIKRWINAGAPEK